MSSSKLQSCLELCWFVQTFLKLGLQNRKRMPFGLARVFHSWFSSERDGVLLEIHNRNEESWLWSVVATTSLNLTVISLLRCQTFLDTSVPCSSLVHSLRLKTSGASLAQTKCTTCCLGYHTSLPFWFCKWLWTLPTSFLPSSGVKVDPTLKLISVCKISPIVGMILTWELRKWSRLPSCRSN
jgi:hypothetical protein